MASRIKKAPPPGSNQPPIIIVKKVVADGHGGHHGGAWKVAYADFVTAMMAFFLLMWLLGATTEKQRKALADYFAPTLIELKQNSAGSDGLFGGQSLIDVDNYPHKAQQTGTKALTVPMGATGGENVGAGPNGALRSASDARQIDTRNFNRIRSEIDRQIQGDAGLSRLRSQVRFVQTKEGLRIDLVDEADFSMFALGTTALVPEASKLVGQIAKSIAPLANRVTVRGHTDSVPYGDPTRMNNWMLSTGRAEATRRRLEQGGVPESRYERIEGVADREPFVADPFDPRNRRISITVLYSDGRRGTAVVSGGDSSASLETPPAR